MNRTALFLLGAALAIAAFIWIVGAPGCNPEPPEADRAREHADSARIAEAVADLYVPQIEAERRRADAWQDSTYAARAEREALERVSAGKTAEADRLLRIYRDTVNGTVNDPVNGTVNPGMSDGMSSDKVCADALHACTEARIEQDRVIRAYRVEVAALTEQVETLTRLDSLRAGEAAALREAYAHMEAAYLGMEEAYESERGKRLAAKRRLWVERAAWVGVLAFAVTR